MKRLAEEAQEVIFANKGDKKIEELADVMELVKAVALLEGKSLDNIEIIRKKKSDERAGFKKRILLETIE